MLAQRALELCETVGVQSATPRDLGVVAEARKCGRLRLGRDVERPPRLRHRSDDVGRPDGVTDTEPCEAVDLRERAQDDDAPAFLEVGLDGVRIVGTVDVLEVRLVDHHEHMVGHTVEEAVELLLRVHRPRRVVRVADVDELRLRRRRVGERVEVVALVAERHGHRRRALLAGVDHVARKRRPAAHDLVAGVERRLAEHVEAAVRAGAHRDLLECDPVPRSQRLVQAVDAPVGIAVELASRLCHRLERGREGRERPLVRSELDDPVEAELALHVLDGPARLVRRQLVDRGSEEARARLGHGRTLPATTATVASRHVWRQPP